MRSVTARPFARDGGVPSGGGRCLEIGLVNNMPDAALKSTERQFARLLGEAAAGHHAVRVRYYTIAEIERGEAIRPHLEAQYPRTTDLPGERLDALIVTGTEPRRTDLRAEPYWPALAEVFDWAHETALPLLASCLAAHAAAFHLDGIVRRRLAAKRFGVFAHHRRSEHALLRGVPDGYLAPHSRWNELPEDDLREAGYDVLSASDEVGVDIFVRRGRQLLVGIQSHPEYLRDTLLREYQRDINRCLNLSPRRIPPMPSGYLDEAGAEIVTRHAASLDPGASATVVPDVAAHIVPDWSTSAARVFRNWLDLVAARRDERDSACRHRYGGPENLAHAAED